MTCSGKVTMLTHKDTRTLSTLSTRRYTPRAPHERVCARCGKHVEMIDQGAVPSVSRVPHERVCTRRGNQAC